MRETPQVGSESACDWLEHWAEATPESTAILSPSLRLSFSNLRKAVEALSLHLVDQGVTRGHTVGISLPAEIDWICSLAVMRIGAASLTLYNVDLGGLDSSSFDFVLVSKAASRAHNLSDKSIVIAAEHMIPDPEVIAISAPYRFGPADPLRLFSAPGELGTMTTASLSHTALAKRLDAMFEIDPEALVQIGLFELASHSGFLNSMKCLARGLPVIAVPAPFHAPAAIQFVEENCPDVLVGSAYEIARFLLQASEKNIVLARLKAIRLLNSTLTEKFFDFVTLKLGLVVTTEYGSIETGPAFYNTIRAKSELSDMGQLVTGAKTKLSTESGSPLLPGEFGIFAIQTLGMMNPKKSMSQVHKGDSGDYFVMPNLVSWRERRFWLGESRLDEVMAGGELFDGREIEKYALDQPDVLETACFPAHGKHGEPVLSIVVVGTKTLSLDSLAESIAARFPHRYPSIYLQRGGIPTYKNGKPHTEFLAQLVS